MRCEGCGKEVSVAGAFPGAKLSCACGADLVVTASSARAGPYRAQVPLPPAPPSRPTPAPRERGQKAAVAPRRMECPRCGGVLSLDPVALCDSCQGAFVEHAALEAALAERAQVVEPPIAVASVDPLDVRYLPCPACSEPMARSLFGKRSGVVVDVCAEHGTWFDSSELERAAQHSLGRSHALGPRLAPRRAPPSEAKIEAARAEVALLNTRYENPRYENRPVLLDIVLDWLGLR